MIGLGQDSSIDLSQYYPAPSAAYQGTTSGAAPITGESLLPGGSAAAGSMGLTPWLILFGGVLLVALVARR